MLAGLTNITFEFGARVIVENATWHIQPNERIGLIGYNGTGKSTLLKVFVGEYLPSAGTVERSRNTSIGYLHQDLLSFESGESILQVALGAFENVLSLEKEIEALGKQLENAIPDSAEQEAALHLYSDKLHEMETLDGYNIHHKTEEVLQGLGFANADLNRPFTEFSGGWRMRVLLAKMILQQPDLLLLDEPTNHLDLPSIEWLEKYLQHYQGAVVIVSHDKYFLDRMVTKIVELYQRQLHIYSGNYSYYETEKQQRIELQQRAFENQQEFIRQQERFIERFRAKASKAAAAQSAMKRLDKIDRLEDVAIERPDIRINFRIDKVPGRTLVTLNGVTKKFGDLTIVENASAEINRGDKIALIGANGKGKSTMLRIIAGAESYSGERKWGHNVEESFYAQHQMEALNINNTVLDEMRMCGSQQTDQELRTLLGCFLFSGDDVEKKIRVLSGGEKARVALAKTMVSKANFLLLDEPTNHLDMHSCELLIEALNKYQGSMIIVSHDRFFISKTANKIWEIDDHKIREFIGTYDEWADWKERSLKAEQKNNKPKKEKSAAEASIAEKQAVPELTPAATGSQRPQTPGSAVKAIDKELKKELQRQQRIFQETESRIAVAAESRNKLEAALGDPGVYSDKDKFSATETEYKKANAELEKLNKDYEKIFEKIMELEEKINA
ncbi:MAG: ABC-F family ATP-binding cassette domain-containing protein [Chitinophagaceae bacterium]|nr:ABC-F family ATP-binding cassette domain-containing protein [Chitinophagaceae bacterium]